MFITKMYKRIISRVEALEETARTNAGGVRFNGERLKEWRDVTAKALGELRDKSDRLERQADKASEERANMGTGITDHDKRILALERRANETLAQLHAMKTTLDNLMHGRYE